MTREIKINELPSKTLFALDKKTHRVVGSAHKVDVKLNNRRGAWLIEDGSGVVTFAESWDKVDRFYREHGCVLRAEDDAEKLRVEGQFLKATTKRVNGAGKSTP